MPRIYADNPAHSIDWGGVQFVNGVGAVPYGTDTAHWLADSYAIDANKDHLTYWDRLTLAELDEVCTYLGVTYAPGATKQTICRAIETAMSTLLLGAAVVVASAAGNTTPADITVRVTSALLAGGQKDVVVPILATDCTVGLIATKIRAALTADADVGAAFTLSGAAGNIILEAKDAAANDATLAIALQDADGSTITFGASGNTRAGVAPVTQQETVTVTAGASAAGTLTVTITAAVLGAGGAIVAVPVALEDNTVDEVATKIRAALAADADVAAEFDIGGEGADILITRQVDAANDATMSIALTAADGTGVTFGASADTRGGVLGVTQQETAAVTATAAVTHAAIAITGAGTYRQTIGDAAATPLYRDEVNGWTTIATGGQIPIAQVGKTITIARVDANNQVLALGNAVIAV